jgi:hypothetical protein
MAKRYIIQKREIKERHGRRPQLMGPYRSVYSDIVPPFDLSDPEKIEAILLKKYGEGRYQVKSIGKEEGEERSRIVIHFSGDVERYKPRAKEWTREERYAHKRSRWRTPREKIFALSAFLVLYLVAFWLLLSAMGSGLDSSIVVVSIIAMTAVLLAAIFFIDIMIFETE